MQRVVVGVVRLHHDAVRTRRDGFDPLCRRRVAREWLLAEYVLACLDRGDRPLRMQGRRQSDIDRIDVRVGNHCFIGGVDARNAVLVSVCPCPVRVTRCDCGNVDSIHLQRRGQQRILNYSCSTEDSNTHRFFIRHFLAILPRNAGSVSANC